MAAEPDRVNSPSIAACVIAGAVFSLVSCLLLHVLYIRMHDAEWDEKVGNELGHEAREMRDKQRAELNGARWVDQAKKIVAVPLDGAKAKVLQEYGAAK